MKAGDSLVYLLGEEGYLYLYVHQPQAPAEMKARFARKEPEIPANRTEGGIGGDSGEPA